LHVVQLMPLYPKTPQSLASFESRSVLPFWYRLAQVVLEKRPLNGCSLLSVWVAKRCKSDAIDVKKRSNKNLETLKT